jgi:hypothetical protein
MLYGWAVEPMVWPFVAGIATDDAVALAPGIDDPAVAVGGDVCSRDFAATGRAATRSGVGSAYTSGNNKLDAVRDVAVNREAAEVVALAFVTNASTEAADAAPEQVVAGDVVRVGFPGKARSIGWRDAAVSD